MRAAFPFLIILGASAPAHANDNEVTLGMSTRTLRSPSANAVTAESMNGGTLSYARSLGIEPIPNLELWAAAGITWGTVSGTMFQTLTTEVDNVGLTLGGRARYLVHPRLAVSGRLDLGAAHASLRLTDRTGHSAQDAHWGAASTTAIAADLLAVVHPNVKLGLRFELGYVATASLELIGKSSMHDARAIDLDMIEASLGHLDLGGPYVSTSMIGQF